MALGSQPSLPRIEQRQLIQLKNDELIKQLLGALTESLAAVAELETKNADQIGAVIATQGEHTATLDRIEQALHTPAGVATDGSFGLPQLYDSKGTKIMSALALKPGQTAVSKMTFSEAGAAAPAPTDGAVMSDNPAVATLALDPTDMSTWTAVGVAVGTCNGTYTGTGADGTPCTVPPMVITVAAALMPESGDFDPGAAVFSGP
jgi:hypothetical protein